MKALFFASMLLAGVGLGDQTEEAKRFCAEFTRSEEKAIAAYPDAAKLDSPLAKIMAQIDERLRVTEDDLYYSSDKPFIIAKRAADALGIKPANASGLDVPQKQGVPSLETTPSSANDASKQPEKLKPGSPEWVAMRDDAWKRLQDYYPEYCDPALLPATHQFVREWDAWAKVNRPDVYENPMKPIIYCKWQKAKEAKEAANREQEETAQQVRQQAAAQAASRAASESFEQHANAYRQKLEEEQAQRESDMAELKAKLLERRVRDLEKAERERQFQRR